MRLKYLALSLLATMALSLSTQMIKADELTRITHEAGYTEALEINRPKVSIVIDAKSGAILWGDKIDEKRDPASMSKLLALYLVYEAMEEGKFDLNTAVTATDTDEAISKIWEISNNKIVAGVDYTVEELIIATLVPSSNVATLMLANLVESDPDKFIDLQNAKAKELGMNNTTFHNATGAVARAFQGYYAPKRHDLYIPNETTARDYAILAYHLVNRFPGILNYTGSTDISIKEGTPYEENFHAYNHSLPGGRYAFEGITGMKTGSSPSAGFNVTATATRGDQSLIAILMGGGDWSDQNGEYYRHPFLNALLEKSFEDYDYKRLAEAGKQTIAGQTVTLEKDFYSTVAKGENPDLIIQDGLVSVENSLEIVSPLIAEEQAVKAKKSGWFNFGSEGKAAENKPVSTDARPTSWLTMLLAIGGTVIFLAGIIYMLEKKGQKNRQNRRKRES